MKKGNNKSCMGFLGVNNKNLWTYSIDYIVSPVLHITLGLMQIVWDDVEYFIQPISNISDAERNIRENAVLLGEQDRIFSSEKNTPREKRNSPMKMVS